MKKKNLEMLKTFLQVMRNNPDAIEKVIPDMYCESYNTIDELHLLSIGIKKLICLQNQENVPIKRFFFKVYRYA